MSFFAKNDIVDVDIPSMNKKTILWTISLIILGIATFYGTLYYLKWQDNKEWERLRQKEQAQEKELTEEEIISKFTSSQPESSKTEYTEEQKKFIEDQTPTPTAKTTTDKKTEQIINQFTKPQ